MKQSAIPVNIEDQRRWRAAPQSFLDKTAGHLSATRTQDRDLLRQLPDFLMRVLTVYGDDERVCEAMCAAACGYLLEKMPLDRLLLSIRDAVNARAPIPGREPGTDQVTPHEVRILTLLLEGHTYKTAAAELGVTPHTISFHLRQIYEKLQVHSKAEAIGKALRLRLLR